MLKKILFGFLILSLSIVGLKGKAQILNQDSITKSMNKSAEHSPKKAAYLSLALPGLGQAYNKKYWKIPIVYAGLGFVTYLWIDNNKSYQDYRRAYITRIDTDLSNDQLYYPLYETEVLRELKNTHWKYRDLNAFIFAGIWALNILDAVVDAHLFTFDLDENLSANINPSISTLAFGKSPTVGLTLSLNF